MHVVSFIAEYNIIHTVRNALCLSGLPDKCPANSGLDLECRGTERVSFLAKLELCVEGT